jgi:TolA-binding protein
VEAEALKGLGLIFRDMGLVDRGAQKADEALKRVNTILKDRDHVPSDLVENAFRLKWESEFLKNDFASATATCKAFNKLYPESILADQALMTLGRTLAERAEHQEALVTFNAVLALKNPISAAEAQYRIGEVHEAIAKDKTESASSSKWTSEGLGTKNKLEESMGTAISAYTQTYKSYPESPYAAKAIEKVAIYYANTNEFAQASGIFEMVAEDYPDAEFMDTILYQWAALGLKMDNPSLAKEKLNQLIYNYPSSPHASEARKMLSAL